VFFLVVIVPDKLRQVHVRKSSEFEILVDWQLDCTYRPGVIKNFNITYCEVATLSEDHCIGMWPKRNNY